MDHASCIILHRSNLNWNRWMNKALTSRLRNMAPTNFTEYENKKTVAELYCSVDLIRGVDGELIFLSALHIFLSITAFLGNTLILVALHKETSLHPPSKLLYRNLAITDLCDCPFPLDVQNEIQLLSEVLCYPRLVCLFCFWLRNTSLVKVGNPISDGIVFVFTLLNA